MARDDIDDITLHRTRGFARSFEDALAQLRRATGIAVRSGAVATMLAMGPGVGFVGCALGPGDETPPAEQIEGSADGWYTESGIRDTNAVRYLRSSWHEYYDCNTRGGCMTTAVFLKIAVAPHEGASLDSKRVGVDYTTRSGETRTAVGRYYTTLEDGMEEWHVRVDTRSYEGGVLRFDAWYEDGLGATFFDDNNGEGHVEAYQGVQSVIYSFLPYSGDANPVTVGPDGVRGRINLMIADLDYDKDIQLVWTTDGWATVNTFGIGAGGYNAVYWVRDTYSGYEEWAVDLDIPGAATTFEYALVYRHGVVNGAEPYEFWDNNYGHNHVIRAGE